MGLGGWIWVRPVCSAARDPPRRSRRLDRPEAWVAGGEVDKLAAEIAPACAPTFSTELIKPQICDMEVKFSRHLPREPGPPGADEDPGRVGCRV